MLKHCLICLMALTLYLASPHSTAEGTPSLSAYLYKKLVESQKLLDDNQFEQSLKLLTELVDKHKYNDYEKGTILHMMGYAYYERGDLNNSVKALNSVLEYDVPKNLNLSTRKLLAQIYMQQANYQKAVVHFKYWLDHSPKPQEEMLILAAQSYYQIQRYQTAIKYTRQAIAMTERAGNRPKESWLTLLQSSLANLDKASDRISTIKLLLRWYPKKEYWLALASAYAQLEKMDNYLAILSLAERKELLTTQAQYLSLAGTYFSEGVPLKSAQVIERGLAQKRIQATEKNLRFLASSYSMAKEYEKSLPPLQKAAELAETGEVAILLGNAYFQLARWQQAADAFELGIEQGNLKQLPTSWMFLGQSYTNLKQFDKASYAFEQAALDEDTSRHAQQWLDYVAYEKQRYQTVGLETTKP